MEKNKKKNLLLKKKNTKTLVKIKIKNRGTVKTFLQGFSSSSTLLAPITVWVLFRSSQ